VLEWCRNLRHTFEEFFLTYRRYFCSRSIWPLTQLHECLHKFISFVSLLWTTHYTAKTWLHLPSISSLNWRRNMWEDTIYCQVMMSRHFWRCDTFKKLTYILTNWIIYLNVGRSVWSMEMIKLRSIWVKSLDEVKKVLIFFQWNIFFSMRGTGILRDVDFQFTFVDFHFTFIHVHCDKVWSLKNFSTVNVLNWVGYILIVTCYVYLCYSGLHWICFTAVIAGSWTCC
jgi:hypothetical protein